jgi:hypothetical protein
MVRKTHFFNPRREGVFWQRRDKFFQRQIIPLNAAWYIGEIISIHESQ